MKKYLLEIAVFSCGAILMIFEIVGSRVVAPYFGTSIYVWTSLIGVILASLSLGYWLGGRLADKRPSFKHLALIIFGASIFILLTIVLKADVMRMLARTTSNMMLGPLMAAVVLFAPASIFLGMVSPYAVRLKLSTIQTSGKTVGNLYAISTIGSIIGTFMAGFLLIPLFGTANILYIISGILILLALTLKLGFLGKGDAVFFIIVLAFGAYDAYEYNTSQNSIFETDTRYNHVQIFEMDYWISGERIQVMKVNNEYSSAMFPDNDSLVYEYTWYYQLAEHFNPEFSHTLMIGGAGYSYPKYYLKKYPEAMIDVVELDPGLTQLAREHFRLIDDPRMRIIHEDGRTYLNKSHKKYDVILGDAYKSLMAMPFHLATLEATQKKYEMLNDNGVVIENVIASLDGEVSELLYDLYATFSEVFPQVYVFACHNPEDDMLLQSISLVALKSELKPEFSNADPMLDDFLQHKLEFDLASRPTAKVLTDDFAPVEYIVMASR